MNDLIGRALGQYEIIEQIGQGGMATVFKAYQPGLDRFVALKILPPALAQQPDFTDRFVREAKVIARLNHPNILPVFDFGHLDGATFLVMRYIAGAQTLRDVMKQRLTLKQMADLIGQVAAALDYAHHQQRIIHRDVKPANVLMDGQWALLSDFGLSKMVDSSVKLTGTGMSMGTPAYMSPEQGRGDTVDHRTDIYALGIILFEMLTGQIPHRAETPLGLLLKRLSEPLPPPRSLNPAIPAAVERVVLKALAFEPAERFDRAAELAQSLKVVVNEAAAAGEMTLFSSKDTPLLAPTVPSPLPGRPAAAPRQKTGSLFSAGQAEAQGDRNRQAMLKLVRDFWIKGVLEQSLHGAARLELGLTGQAEAVEQPWEMVVQTPSISALTIPAGTSMSEVFTTMGEALLILGEPGSGKTTMLLELAREKLDSAAADPAQPMPVVFNLSSWQAGRPPRPQRFSKPLRSLEAWLVDELNTRYHIPKKIARSWVKNDELLPLLDGLDEVAAERREACVQAINEYRQEHLVPIVVCSRVADYELLTTKLKLQGAVLIQPLVRRQVEAYLAQAGPELAALRDLLGTDETLHELTRSPLLLSVMTLAYRGKRVDELAHIESMEARRQHLFETYTEQMFRRRGANPAYSPAQTTRWLGWLTQKMREHNQTIFQIEQLQPGWLPTKWQRWVYLLGSRWLNGLGFIWLAWLIILWILFIETGGFPELLETEIILGGLVLGLAMGLVSGLVTALIDGWGFAQTSRNAGSQQAASLGRIAFHIVGNWLGISLSLTALFGLRAGWLGWLALESNEGIRVGLQTGLVGDQILVVGMNFAALYGIFFGLRGSRRDFSTDVQPIEKLGLSWGNAWRGAIKGAALGYFFFVMLAIADDFTDIFVRGLSVSWSKWLLVGLLGVPLGGLTGAIFGGLSQGQIETKTAPNQGIRLSVRNAFLALPLVGLAFGLVIFLFILVGSLIEEGNFDLPGALWITLTMGLAGGVLAVLWYGGLEVIQHVVLRAELYFMGHLPWKLSRFLEYGVDRIFLRRVGGGYIFTHRLLLEHFARQAPAISASQPAPKGRLAVAAGASFLFLCVVVGGLVFMPTLPWNSGFKHNSLIAQADAHYENGRYEQAIADYTKAIEIKPENAGGYYLRGRAFDSLGDDGQAIADYAKVIEVADPSLHTDIYILRGNIYYNQGKYEQALADYDKFIERWPENWPRNPNNYISRGNAYFGLGQYESAIADYTQAIELDPDDAVYYTNRGGAYRRQGEYEPAIADYTTAIELDPDYARAYNQRGIAYESLEDYEQAIADYTKAIELNPRDAVYYANRGGVYDDLEQYDQAIADYTKAIELDPVYARAYNRRGFVYEDMADYERAVADFTKAIELNPEYAVYYANRGDAYDDWEQYELALADYTRAIELDPEYEWAYKERGDTYDALEEYDLAIADYTKAIELDPGYAEAYRVRGITYRNTGDFENALRDFDRAIKLEPDDAASYGSRGITFSAAGDPERALADFNQALALNPELGWLYLERGVIYKSSGQPEQARQDFAKALELDAEDVIADALERGEIFESLGNLAGALGYYETYLNLAPDAPGRQDIASKVEQLKAQLE